MTCLKGLTAIADFPTAGGGLISAEQWPYLSAESVAETAEALSAEAFATAPLDMLWIRRENQGGVRYALGPCDSDRGVVFGWDVAWMTRRALTVPLPTVVGNTLWAGSMRRDTDPWRPGTFDTRYAQTTHALVGLEWTSPDNDLANPTFSMASFRVERFLGPEFALGPVAVAVSLHVASSVSIWSRAYGQPSGSLQIHLGAAISLSLREAAIPQRTVLNWTDGALTAWQSTALFAQVYAAGRAMTVSDEAGRVNQLWMVPTLSLLQLPPLTNEFDVWIANAEHRGVAQYAALGALGAVSVAGLAAGLALDDAADRAGWQAMALQSTNLAAEAALVLALPADDAAWRVPLRAALSCAQTALAFAFEPDDRSLLLGSSGTCLNEVLFKPLVNWMSGGTEETVWQIMSR